METRGHFIARNQVGELWPKDIAAREMLKVAPEEIFQLGPTKRRLRPLLLGRGKNPSKFNNKVPIMGRLLDIFSGI